MKRTIASAWLMLYVAAIATALGARTANAMDQVPRGPADQEPGQTGTIAGQVVDAGQVRNYDLLDFLCNGIASLRFRITRTSDSERGTRDSELGTRTK